MRRVSRQNRRPVNIAFASGGAAAEDALVYDDAPNAGRLRKGMRFSPYYGVVLSEVIGIEFEANRHSEFRTFRTFRTRGLALTYRRFVEICQMCKHEAAEVARTSSLENLIRFT
jgi:hypothetical protein